MQYLQEILLEIKQKIESGESDAWHKQNPVHFKNIVNHYDQSNENERTAGMNWYSEAHNVAKSLSSTYKVPHHVMSGLIANYSPQTHWAQNLLTASTVARTKIPLGGPRSGVFASNLQKGNADRMLKGEHYDNILKGNKIRTFGHLIEHGGDADPKNPRVCVDRHAFSVAAGKRAPDHAYASSGLKGKKRYNELSTAYKQAAEHVSKRDKVDVKPHQMQAITWLTRQRLNENEAKNLSVNMKSKVGSHAETAHHKWSEYIGEHHPEALHQAPKTGYGFEHHPDDHVDEF